MYVRFVVCVLYAYEMKTKWKREALDKAKLRGGTKKKMKEYKVEEEKVRRICDFIGLCMDELK